MASFTFKNPMGDHEYREPKSNYHLEIKGAGWETQYGSDLHARAGTPVYAPIDGKIVGVDTSRVGLNDPNAKVFGAQVRIESADGQVRSFVTHIENLPSTVKVGAEIHAGDKIGEVSPWKYPHAHVAIGVKGDDGKFHGIQADALLHETRGTTDPMKVDVDVDGSGYTATPADDVPPAETALASAPFVLPAPLPAPPDDGLVAGGVAALGAVLAEGPSAAPAWESNPGGDLPHVVDPGTGAGAAAGLGEVGAAIAGALSGLAAPMESSPPVGVLDPGNFQSTLDRAAGPGGATDNPWDSLHAAPTTAGQTPLTEPLDAAFAASGAAGLAGEVGAIGAAIAGTPGSLAPPTNYDGFMSGALSSYLSGTEPLSRPGWESSPSDGSAPHVPDPTSPPHDAPVPTEGIGGAVVHPGTPAESSPPSHGSDPNSFQVPDPSDVPGIHGMA